jgi:hypothetical protein
MTRKGTKSTAVSEGNSGFCNIHDDDVFTPEQLAAFLGVDVRTVSGWSNRDEDGGEGPRLKRWKSGKVIFIRGVHVKRFFDGLSTA